MMIEITRCSRKSLASTSHGPRSCYVENDIDAESDGWRRWSAERLESEAADIGEQLRKRVPIMQGKRRWNLLGSGETTARTRIGRP